jgi:hypothetical protein
MRSKSFESITINRRAIHWDTLSGTAIGVQKYTKTHVSGGYKDEAVSSSIETIIEFSIQQDNGNETEIVLRQEKIRVRDGQHVSIIWGYTSSRRDNIIFINHDNDRLYWLCTPTSFFEHIGIFITLSSESAIFLMVMLVAISIYILLTASISTLAVIGVIIGIAGILFYQIQRNRVQVAWNIIEPQIVEIAKQLRQ